MPKAVKVKFPGTPAVFKKNARHIVFHGDRCTKCGKKPHASIVPGHLPKSVTDGLPERPVSGPVMLTILAYWKGMHRTSRAPGQPQGDADAVISAISDALNGKLYHDDAQVALVVAASAYDKANPRVEVTVAPLSRPVLELLQRETGLAFTTATLSLGQQVEL